MFTIALLGNPNSGKTTLFNLLTGAWQHVGNWSGVTIEKKTGKMKLFGNIVQVVDLPGIYSLEPTTTEQIISKNFLTTKPPNLIVNVIDATNLERGLYLTDQLLDLGMPLVLAVNMMDALPSKGIEVDLRRLEYKIGVKVVGISSIKGYGKKELISTIYETLNSKKVVKRKSFAKTTEERYKFVNNVYDFCVQTHKKYIDTTSNKIDKLINNKIVAFPLFFIIYAAFFYIIFGPIGQFLSRTTSEFLGQIQVNIFNSLVKSQVSEWVVSLSCNGVISCLSSILSFLPQLVIVFAFISILEDSGYMARVAFLMDRPMRKIGFSGTSFISLILGFGCSVPAILSTRILENEKNKRLTILAIPFISCSAKMPVYMLFISSFFENNGVFIILLLYSIGIITVLVSSFIINKTLLKREKTNFVLELPPYRMPSIKGVAIKVLNRIKDFILKAGTVLLIAGVFIWFLQSFDISIHYTIDSSKSILAEIGRMISPFFRPLGFGFWEASVALVSGIVAKEVIVSTFSILCFSSGKEELILSINRLFTPLSAFSFLTFVLLSIPCFATVSMIFKETRSFKWTIISITTQLFWSWSVSFLVYNIGKLLGF